MSALVFGKSGQVALELARIMPEATFLGRDDADLSDPAACAAAIASSDADVVINAAAYTAVDLAETETVLARTVNADAPGAMARAAAARGLPFLHISTDYVFDGSGDQPWRENDPTGPLGVYGQTKLDGERQVVAAGGAHAVLRTAWVFSAHGKNFVKTMLRLAETRDTLGVVADQYGSPTAASAIAAALGTIANAFRAGRGQAGIFHFAGTPSVTWADFAEAIFSDAGQSRRPAVNRIRTADFPTPARRPANSRLDCARIRTAYGIEQPDWRADLSRVVKELQSK